MKRSSQALGLIGRTAPSGLLALCGLLVVGLVWQLTASAVNPSQLAPPVEVWHALINDWSQIPGLYYLEFQSGGIAAALGYSAVNVLFGVAVGAALGLPLGIALARIRMVRSMLAAPLSLMRTVPLVALLPFLTLWFGTSGLAQSGLVIWFAFLAVMFAAESAAITVSEHYANFASSLGASDQRILWTVVLPATGPTVIGAVRVALAAGWSWEAVAELLGAHHGVGRAIEASAQLGRVADIEAIVLAIAVVAVLCDTVVAAAGAFLVRWRPS